MGRQIHGSVLGVSAQTVTGTGAREAQTCSREGSLEEKTLSSARQLAGLVIRLVACLSGPVAGQ